MAAELITGLGIFKTLLDIAKGLKDIDTATARNAVAIELQEKIFAAHTAYSALLERVSQLEKQVTNFERWETEKQDYEMKALASGSIVYALKPSVQGTKPPHYICANCYEHQKKIPIQMKPRSSPSIHLGIPPQYVCPECKSEIVA
jgi:CII-binding regulator of phage lambda lysogenization HflD